MEKVLRYLRLPIFLMFFTSVSFAQTTVFNDEFEEASGLYYSITPGPIGTSTTWNMTRSGSDFAAGIKDYMKLNNDGSGSANTNGWVLASTNASAFASPYNTTLANNVGMVTWTFNMRQIQSNPNGFTAADYGVAYILAGTSGTTNVVGTGYAVVLGSTGTVDPIRLVRYNAGLRNHTTLITSATTGLTDFGNQYLSIKVTYTPGTNTWQLFLRNDGATAFELPTSGNLTSQGTAVNNSYTATALTILGCYWNASTTAAQTAFFDNAKVTVAVPTITSIAPTSRTAGTGAFTLTVNGTNFVSGASVIRWNGANRTTTYISPTQLTAAVPAADIATSGTASITVANSTAVSNAQTFTIDPAGVPTLTISTNALANLTTVTGTASSALTYTISGANLTVDPIITPPANFELSLNGTLYTNILTLPRTANALTGQPVTIYVRIKASAPAGIYAGNIDNSVSGGSTKQIMVSGMVLAAQPATQSTAVTFTNVTSAGFTVNWTNGNGMNRLVLIRASGAVNASPVDGNTYTGASAFGTGSEIGAGNFTAYTGIGNSANITGLNPATAYHVAVFEFNGSSGTQNYLTTTPAVGNKTTLNAPIGWQIYTANTNNTINFDTTVDGVNTDAFQADGISPNSESGELNSNAWAITGFSDGAMPFGATYTEDQDYDRGLSGGGVSEGGVYAFETAADNYALGIQPATGDFTPGSVTLRFQNQTGSAVTSVNIGYKVYVYNDEPASSSFNFSYSADNVNYTALSGLNVVSPAAADNNPGWKAYYRVVTLTGLNIANNNYYYIRWTGAAVSGAAAFDEFALDDIVLTANPTSNFAPFSGTAENFVVQGNAILSANTTVGDLSFNAGKLDMNGKTLTLNGTVTNAVTGGLKGGLLSNLIVGGAVSPSLSFDQTTVGTTNLLNNFNIATTNANTTTILNPVVVNGNLSTAAGQSLNFGANALTGALSAIANNGTIMTQNTTAVPLPVNKNWGATGTIHYNAASALQTVVSGTYNHLTVSPTGGGVAGGALSVNGNLNLPTANPSATVGSLSMASYTLTMGGNAINVGDGDVTGIVTRTSIAANTLYTFGQANTSIIFPNTGTLPTAMSLKIVIGTAPAWRPGAIKRTYDFIQTGGANTKAVIKAHYLDSELNGNIETKLVDWARIVAANTTLEQGRSNFNTIDNWVELTNVNVGLYFSNVFDAVLLTLDESEANSLTWNGSVSNSWTTAANWSPNATPSDNTAVFIPNASTTPNDPLLNPLVLLGTLTIDEGGILNAPADSQFTINGAGGAWINNGIFNPGSGTSRVIFTNVDASIAGITNFNNVTINSGAGLRPVTNNVMRIGGAFVVNGSLSTGAITNTVEYFGSNQTIAVPTGSLAAYHNLIINGTSSIFPTSLNVTGNLTLNQAANFTGKTLAMVGNELQTISGTAAPSFNNLTINNSFGDVNLNMSADVDGTLSLISGRLNIGSQILTLGNNAVTGSFNTGNMIIAGGTGKVRRRFTSAGSYTFPIGEMTGTADYSPITVTVTAGTFSNAYVGVSVTDAIHPNNASLEQNISRYWNVSQTGITGAVATISANYTIADITGLENDIAAAQLNGSFSQQNNPWIKFASLSSNTLTATSATLTPGTTSVFTGIKGSPFSVLLTGYGEFCKDEAVTLAATPTGGNAPYTYMWSGGLGTQETTAPSTAVVGTTNYTVTIKDRNGITVSDSNNVVVLPPSVGGTLSADQYICASTPPADISLSGQTGAVMYWQSAADNSFTGAVNISNTTTILPGSQIGNLAATTYFRAVIKNGSCAEVFSAPTTVILKSTTWDGTVWSNGEPDASTAIIFTGNYTSAANLSGCTATVSNNATVTIASGLDFALNGSLTVAPGSNFILNNNAGLLQSTNDVNSGNITVKRKSAFLKRQDYTLWSSPVSGQNLLAFSPGTLVTPTSRFYTYNTSTNLYNSVVTPSAVAFESGKGYLIRVPNTHPVSTPTQWNGQFTGIPHNGPIDYTMTNIDATHRFNLVGNPYPSPISAVTFVNDNNAAITGTLYFWRKTNDASKPSYCSWSKAGGGSGTFVSNNEAQDFDPLGVIQTGQGFFVEASASATTLQFNNGQRIANHANQFFRNGLTMLPPASESHRVWLNVANGAGNFCQTAVGYFTDATLEVDHGVDAKFINDSAIELYTLIGTDKFVIQGRPVPFDIADAVPMGFKAATAGDFTIAIDHVDGLFDSQDIFIKDHLTGAQHNLKSGAYAFTSDTGTFNNRFELLYQNALGTDNPVAESAVIVYKRNGLVFVKSGNMIIDNIKVFDIRGRLLAERKAVNGLEASIDVGEANQVLIVKITSDSDETITRKTID